MTTAHDEVPVTYDKVEDVSKKRDAVLSNSVCKIPKAFFKQRIDFSYLKFGLLKKPD